MSPTLLLLSNPAALRRAMETGGASLADGARNLLHDLKEGRLSMVDATAFAPGRNLAMTPGKVVYRNRLIELIQYAPTTETVHADAAHDHAALDQQVLHPRHAAEEQHGAATWSSRASPSSSSPGRTRTRRWTSITIEDYMDLGPLAASDVVREITGSPTVNVMGYCIGGTLLAMTLAWLADTGRQAVQLGDLHGLDAGLLQGRRHRGLPGRGPKIDFIEQQMMERGYLDSREMSNMFNLLRSNDLIWSNVVNNYLLGEKPPAFDLLYWNSDGTRMAGAAHSWYLRNTYVENNLIEPGKITLKGEPIDLGRITQDVYAVGAEKDHIVPWEAAWRITQLPAATSASCWRPAATSPGSSIRRAARAPTGSTSPASRPPTAEEWRESARGAHEGSWWTDWFAWLAKRSGKKVKPPALGSEQYPVLQDAPGSYVLEK